MKQLITALFLLIGLSAFSQEITTGKVRGFVDQSGGTDTEFVQEIYQIDRFNFTDSSIVHTCNEYRFEYIIKGGRTVEGKEIYLIEGSEGERFKVRVDHAKSFLDVESRQNGAFIRLRYFII